MIDDGVERGRQNLVQLLRGKKRIFVCGLALDFCVADSCHNARAAGFDGVYMVLDAARAAHIPGIGSFGSGFLQEPQDVVGKLRQNKVGFVSTQMLTGIVPVRDARPTDKVVIECVADGAKVRAKIVSGGPYDPTKNVQFPRGIRVAGKRFVVDTVVDAGSFYRVRVQRRREAAFTHVRVEFGAGSGCVRLVGLTRVCNCVMCEPSVPPQP